jgi:hypothetical protein
MIFAEESSRPEDRRCLRFKCSSFYELNAMNTLPVHDLSAVNAVFYDLSTVRHLGHVADRKTYQNSPQRFEQFCRAQQEKHGWQIQHGADDRAEQHAGHECADRRKRAQAVKGLKA